MNKDACVNELWNYLQLNQTIQKSDIIIALGNRDERTAYRAAELMNEMMADYLVISGGVRYRQDSRFEKWQGLTEAEYFRQIAISNGVPKEKILLENQAANTGENIKFSYTLLKTRGIKAVHGTT